mgnify:CR=1 FL=1
MGKHRATECHIRVVFADIGLVRDYVADRVAAHNFAARAWYIGSDLRLSIDDDVRPEFKPLPCQPLWAEA